MRGAEADINLDALVHNLKKVRTFVGNRKILAVIKSDGYGHGAVRVARTLIEADGFGVASLNEAVNLRLAGVTQPILIMSQFAHSKDLKVIADFNLSIVVHHENQLRWLEQNPCTNAIQVWLKIDSGMHRLGFRVGEIHSVWQRLKAISWIDQPVCLMTHLACADECNDQITLKQVETFTNSVADLPGERSISNSAGILHYPQIQQDWVRPGLILYGVSPFANQVGFDFGLKPAMTLRSCLISVKQAKAGDLLGYGGCFVCPENMPIGVAEIGYGDGYPRSAESGTPVLVNGALCAVAGRVSMDLLTIDLRSNPQAKVGDPVTLWGEGLPIEQVSKFASTIPWELLCHMGERVRFREIQ